MQATSARSLMSSTRWLSEPGRGAAAETPRRDAASGKTHDDSDSASRAALWNQMLNTIIVDNGETSGSGRQRGSGAGGAGEGQSSAADELENEFRSRTTAGLDKPASPESGRSFSVYSSNAQGKGAAAVLYRNMMSTLRRNNVRRELKLMERYEKPNQMRRRKRSERHRRRFADMIRKKVQLVRRSRPPRLTDR